MLGISKPSMSQREYMMWAVLIYESGEVQAMNEQPGSDGGPSDAQLMRFAQEERYLGMRPN